MLKVTFALTLHLLPKVRNYTLLWVLSQRFHKRAGFLKKWSV